jgi:conjugal transfer pilus assembly protein TraW
MLRIFKHAALAALIAVGAVVTCVSAWGADKKDSGPSKSKVGTSKPIDEVVGTTYEILEADLLEEIMAKLRRMEKSGELAKKQEQWKEQAIRSIEQPRGAEGLGVAMTNRSYVYDPSVTTTAPLMDALGVIIIPAGTRSNPLDYVNFGNPMVFFDGRDGRQVEMIRNLYAQRRGELDLVMVAGGPLDFQRKWKTRVFFDQGGSLVRQMGIRNVPALVSQDGKVLRIDELALY